MSFLDIALSCIARGWYVFPCVPGNKEPLVKGGFKAASNDPVQIQRWWERWPEANVAIATGASGLTVLDIDKGLTCVSDVANYAARYGLFTYAVRTGRRDGYGVQLYFQGGDIKSIAWAHAGLSGDIRSNTGYVMAAGCLHPSGELYEVLWDRALEPTPDFVLNLKPAPIPEREGKANERVQDDGGIIDDHRNVHMISLLGRKRAEGADDEELRAYAIELNATRFSPPLDEDELERLILNACKFPVPEPDPVAVIGLKEPEAPKDWRDLFHSKDEMENAPPVTFLIEGFLPDESIAGLAAPAGQRKSLIALNVAHALLTGEALFDKFKVLKQPERVLYLCPEMGIRSFTDRLRKIGLMGEVGTRLFCRTMSSTTALELDDLPDEALAGAVVILDTAIRYLKGDENSSVDMQKFAATIFRLSAAKAMSVLVLHHSSKGAKESNELTLENALRGSSELGAFMTTCWSTRLQNPVEPFKSASYVANVKPRDYDYTTFEITSGPDCRLHFVQSDTPVTLQTRNKPNKDGKDEAAIGILRAYPKLSTRETAALLKEHGIKRGKDWVQKMRAELCQENGGMMP